MQSEGEGLVRALNARAYQYLPTQGDGNRNSGTLHVAGACARKKWKSEIERVYAMHAQEISLQIWD